MMFTNSIIHLFEVITLIMVGAFVVQLSRCYLHFSRATVADGLGDSVSTRANAPSMKVIVNISSSGREPSVVPDDSSKKISEAPLNQVPGCTASIISEDSSHGQILNDYIGEFFAESVPANIDQFRSSSNPIIEREVIPQEPFAQSEQNEAECLDEIIVVEGQDVAEGKEKIQAVILEKESSGLSDLPVLREIVPTESVMDEDSVITVANVSLDKASEGKVMSDKVVHAMLDEARLVCSS
jgi:hypothetical protein